MGDTATLLRLIAACGLVGLLTYSAAHVVNVWRRRNAKPANQPAAGRPGRKAAWAALVAGLVLAPAAAALRELTWADGVLSGEDLFVVRARDDLAVEWLHDREWTGAGEPLARFGSGPSAARTDELRARLARAEAERDVLALSPLTPDPELTRRHQRVSQERAQVQQEFGQSLAAAEASDRDLNSLLLAKKEALAKLEGTLTDKRKELDRATIRLAHNQELSRTYDSLRLRQAVTLTEQQEQQKALKEAESEVTSLTKELKAGAAEKELIQAHLAQLEAARSDPARPLEAQLAGLRTRLTRLEAEEAELKAALTRDADRAAKLREAELSQAAAKVRECQAGLAVLAGGQEARAPFAGRVAYRAPSPNAVRPGGPLLVLGPEGGALLTARLARSEADALRAGAEVVLDLGDGAAERRVPARFRGVRELAHEPGQAALQLDCQPPPEVVRRLAEGERLAVAFAWKPPLAGMWPFRVGVVFGVGGLVGLYLTRRRPAPADALAGWDLSKVVSPKPAPAPAAAAPAADPTLEVKYRDTLERVNKAGNPEESARLLAQLHELRDALSAQDRNVALPREFALTETTADAVGVPA